MIHRDPDVRMNMEHDSFAQIFMIPKTLEAFKLRLLRDIRGSMSRMGAGWYNALPQVPVWQ